MPRLTKLHVAGYKSLRDVELDFGPVNVLIGANGSGKSNLVSLFKMLNRAMKYELRLHVAEVGGADALLHYGTRVTSDMVVDLRYRTDEGTIQYIGHLVPTAPDTLSFGLESAGGSGSPHQPAAIAPRGETHLPFGDGGVDAAGTMVQYWLSNCRVYQFADTSQHSALRKHSYTYDSETLRADAGNLAPYLHMLKASYPDAYSRIIETIRLAAPFFGDFAIEPLPPNQNNVILNWRERGRDQLFGPHQLSDGTLRFAALATLLLQPEELLPSLIVIDEPELGLHPYALTLLASLVRSVSAHTQVLLSTQSGRLVDEFEPEDVVVVDRVEGETTCSRLDAEELAEWLEEYSVGELWEKNVIGGRPAR